MDSLIYFGDALKALDDKGKIGGYLVRFTSADQKDLTGEYFTADTYLGAQEGNGTDTIFHHGQPLPIKAKLTAKAAEEIRGFQDHIFAPVKTKRDTVGIWAETVLDMADEYEKTVFGLVKANKLGWSSGAVGHLVRKAKDGQITRWPIGEASITPTPAEPLNRALPVKSLDSLKFVAVLDDDEDEGDDIKAAKKAGIETTQPVKRSLAEYLNQLIDDRVDDGQTKAAIIARMAREAGIEIADIAAILDGTDPHPVDARLKAFARVLNVSFDTIKSVIRRDHLQTIKGMFEEALAERTPSRWELESTYCDIIKKLATASQAAAMAGVEFDLEAKVKEATAEYTTLLQDHALGQIQSWIDEGGDDDFYLKTIASPTKDILSGIPIDLSDHSDLLVNGLKSVTARFRGNHEHRVKAGRVLSEKNRRRIADLMEQMKAVSDDLQSLLDESQPMATDAQKRAALTKHLMRKHQSRLSIGV